MLVGLMGAGKTTVGRICAERMGRPFVDTDEVVESLAHATVAEIFATDGEGRFRELERQVIADVVASPEALVVACGGGSVVDPQNRRRLRAAGRVVWLRAQPAVLHERVGDGVGRPLIATEPLSTLERLAATREAAYTEVAHAIVDTEGLDPRAVADAALAEWAEVAE